MYNFDDLEFGYSEEGLAGRVELLREFVNVEFYFEDENNEQFYEVWLNALFPDLTTEYVFCLGGKDPVIKESKKENKSGNPRIFILDKDFDDLLEKHTKIEGIVRLNAYSIENYFINYRALSDVAISKFEGLRLHKIHAYHDEIKDRLDGIFTRYTKLAKLFYAVRKFRLKNIQTSKKRISELIFDKTVDGILPECIIEDYIRKIIIEANKQGNRLEDLNVINKELLLNFQPKIGCTPIGEDQLAPNCPGKHLFRLLCTLFDRVCGTKFENIASQMILISLIQNIPNFSNLFETVKFEISESIDRQSKVCMTI